MHKGATHHDSITVITEHSERGSERSFGCSVAGGCGERLEVREPVRRQLGWSR